jgi:(4-O-methyl)-D-glucuronate---lignin esterase
MRLRGLSLALLLGGISSLACWSGGNRNGSSPGSGGGGGSGPTKPPLGMVTTCAGGDAPLPALADLPTVAALPDPFQSLDGTRITGADQWACRRVEIAAQAAVYELGDKPAKPASVTGAFDGGAGKITVTASDGAKMISFDATITLPTAGTAPYPAMIGIGGVSIGATQLAAMGVATINFPNDAVAQQADGSSRGKGLFYDLYGADHSAGAMMAWAWGVSRLIDAIEQTPAAQIDPARLGVTGCSRNGKGALIVGAFDDRIVLTIPQESGSGGSASWRVSDAQVVSGTAVQTLSEITGENVWFRKSFSQFNAAATQLPFDHHMIEGLVAPRALLIIENTSQVWLGNLSTYDDSMAAHQIWEALGIPDMMGVSQIGDHSHCMWNGSQQAEVTAYVQKFLIGGGTASTSVLKTDGGYTFDKASWAPWDVPALQL